MSFETAIARVLKHEGGFTADPTDRGNWTTGVVGRGELKGTKYGISAMAYPKLDILNLTEKQAADIYRKDYWNPLKCDQMHLALGYQLLDYAVNSGIDRAAKALQKIVGVRQDGVIGNITLNAATVFDQQKAAILLVKHRLDFLTSIRTFNTFGRGWVSRVADNIEYLANDAV